jgi:hypothetical protein
MIYIVKGRQRRGKTTVAIGIAIEYVLHCGYKTSEIYSLVRLYKPNGEELQDYHFMTIREMRLFVLHMIEKDIRHVILLIDEIDRVFPHRFWNKLQQSEALLGLWQDEKLFIIIIGTAHVGKAIDKTIRESMQMEIIAEIDKPRQVINLGVIDILNKRVFAGVMGNVSLVQKCFNTRQPVKL